MLMWNRQKDAARKKQNRNPKNKTNEALLHFYFFNPAQNIASRSTPFLIISSLVA